MKYYITTLTLSFGLSSLAYGADTLPTRGVTATGTCLKKVSQDRASVVLTASVLAPSPGDASRDATRQSQKLRDAVVSLKLENVTLETTGFSVYEDRQYENKKMISKGFRARQGLSVETSDIARIGEAIAAAAKMGIKEVDNLTTFVSPEKSKVEYENCLEVAAKNARDKALKLAKGAGIKIGRVLQIREGTAGGGESPMNYKVARVMSMASADAEAAPAPTIDARAEDMTVSATVTFDTD